MQHAEIILLCHSCFNIRTKCLAHHSLRHHWAVKAGSGYSLETIYSQKCNHCYGQTAADVCFGYLVLWDTFAQFDMYKTLFSFFFSFFKEIQLVPLSTSLLLYYCLFYFLVKVFAHKRILFCFYIGLYIYGNISCFLLVYLHFITKYLSHNYAFGS